jgi:hypothetical protein
VATYVTGLGAVGILLPVAMACLKDNGNPYHRCRCLPALDAAYEWLLRHTPATGFVVEYPQATAHYAQPAGNPPLPGLARLTLLYAYTATVMLIATGGSPAKTH